jgi:hypothetical protein
MAAHNKLTFAAEYCRARRIPYKIKDEALFIAGRQICYSLYNLTYGDILRMIDEHCIYDALTQFYITVKKV